MKFSSKGIDFLIELEGLKAQAYKDTADKWTIGIGHLIKPSEKELMYRVLSKPEAVALAYEDLRTTEALVNRLVKVPLNQQQYDALVIFAFNIGTQFQTSTVLRLLNEGNYKEACMHLDDWVKVTKGGRRVFSQGLQNRRDEEQELFFNGDYTKQR
jgi:lysozyme